MDPHEAIRQFDLVRVIEVPENLEGIVAIGDIGVVIEKLDEETFEIECITSDGSFKWLETLTVRYVSKQLQTSQTERSHEKHLMQESLIWGTVIGITVGGLIGTGLGSITGSMNGVLIGLAFGLLLGGVTGAITAALTVRTAGTTGGIGVGYYTGMIFGGVFGLILGALIPPSLGIRARTEGLPVLDALAMGRFQTAVLFGFFLSILGTIVGVWVGGRNSIPKR